MHYHEKKERKMKMEMDMEMFEIMEQEREILHHFNHWHPLSLIEPQVGDICFGCWRYFSVGEEAAYGCRIKTCGYKKLLHEECAEMAMKITHPMHRQHVLMQKHFGIVPLERGKCAVCERHIPSIGYSCTSGCVFQIHLGCASESSADSQRQQTIFHRSHRAHKLRLLRRRHSFRCDACGTIEKGTNSSYICSICNYWIHESCADLPRNIDVGHQHMLSLAFSLPPQYHKIDRKCERCRKNLLLKHWVYHCEGCGYVVHTKCSPFGMQRITAWDNYANAADDEDIIQFPINDISKELIRPFVMRERGELVIPQDDKIINGKHQSHNHHHHQLSLISSSSHDQTKEEENNDEDDHGRRSELICDGCTTPIHHNKHKSSSSSDSHNYMSCGECKYFLHLSCFDLPLELPSHPLHHQDHKLMLQTCPKHNFGVLCHICRLATSGLFYTCASCDFAIDIKCASMPNTITHAAHPQQYHYLKLLVTKNYDEDFGPYLCGGCGYRIDVGIFYRCDSCEFILCFGCASLPATNMHRWDEHPLRLIYDADVNHRSPFYCEICEQEMNPKMWMYHCRECDQSFHPNCLPVTSGEYRNIKFGQKYVITTCHDPHHPLTYRLITTKGRCDLCHDEDVCGRPGFECAPCNFVMCFYKCGEKHKNAMEAIGG